jgi:hypothetical protein
MIEIKSLSDALKFHADFAARAEQELTAARKNALQILRKLGAQQVTDALMQAKAALAAAEAERREGIEALDERVAQCRNEVERLQEEQRNAADAGVVVETPPQNPSHAASVRKKSARK